jgi:hypothetical protein
LRTLHSCCCCCCCCCCSCCCCFQASTGLELLLPRVTPFWACSGTPDHSFTQLGMQYPSPMHLHVEFTCIVG